MKKEQYVTTEDLSISEDLYKFVNDKLLPRTRIKTKDFWKGFSKIVSELAPKNKVLLEKRDELQKKIDSWHKERKGEKFDIKKYANFLKKIGYLKKPGQDFKIKTKNVDTEIAKI